MKKLAVLLLLCTLLACENQSPTNENLATIAPAVFAEKLQEDGVIILDVRTEGEFQEGHVEGALQHDYYETDSFKGFLEGLDKSKTYLIYCRSGGRSGTTLDMMAQMGFDKVYNLDGGFNAWKAANLPVSR
jgi:phage shock protein E